MIESGVWYSLRPTAQIIEAVVTGNIGYNVNEVEPVFTEGSGAKQILEDGTVITDPDHLNLQWHLLMLRSKKVITFLDPEESRLPLISRLPVEIIHMPDLKATAS